VVTATRAHVRMGRSATHGQKLRRAVEARPMRTGGLGATHCNISVMIAQQMMTNIPPSIRRLAGVIVLFPHRIAHESIPLIAKSCMIPKKYMYQMFE
jgi:hypothetical protein